MWYTTAVKPKSILPTQLVDAVRARNISDLAIFLYDVCSFSKCKAFHEEFCPCNANVCPLLRRWSKKNAASKRPCSYARRPTVARQHLHGICLLLSMRWALVASELLKKKVRALLKLHILRPIKTCFMS